MSYGSSKWRDWVLDYDAALPFFRQAHEAGVNFYDTADMYSDGASEEVLGRALKELAVPREQVVIASKLFNPTGTSATPSRTPCAGWAPITLTSTRFTATTAALRWKKPSTP